MVVSGKKVTPSVTALGDTNFSYATAFILCLREFPNISHFLPYQR